MQRALVWRNCSIRCRSISLSVTLIGFAANNCTTVMAVGLHVVFKHCWRRKFHAYRVFVLACVWYSHYVLVRLAGLPSWLKAFIKNVCFYFSQHQQCNSCVKQFQIEYSVSNRILARKSESATPGILIRIRIWWKICEKDAVWSDMKRLWKCSVWNRKTLNVEAAEVVDCVDNNPWWLDYFSKLYSIGLYSVNLYGNCLFQR